MTNRRRTFVVNLYRLRDLPIGLLVDLVRDRRHYSVLYRLAALRTLICKAPLDVTQGRCYAQRKRLVRQAYQC